MSELRTPSGGSSSTARHSPDDLELAAQAWPESLEDDRHARHALDRLLQGFQIVGFDWRYRYLNPAAARHGGLASPRDLVGRTMMDAFPGIEQTALFSRLRRCMQERSTDAFDNEFTYPDGTSRWFDIRVQPAPEGLCIYSIDIQDRKVAEQHLRQKVADLEAHRDSRRGLFGRVRALFRAPRESHQQKTAEADRTGAVP